MYGTVRGEDEVDPIIFWNTKVDSHYKDTCMMQSPSIVY